jgi:group I intron endonuclease
MSVKENISMIIYSIYKVVNRVNGKVYIGYTNNFNRRKSCHKHLALVKKSNGLFHKAIRKYGMENFEWSIIYQSKDKHYCKNVMEKNFIKENNCRMPYGYNITPGGDGGILYEKTLQRMINDNPGKTKESLFKKTSKILAKNVKTKEVFIVENRKEFSEQKQIPYPSIGWAIQNNKILKSGWKFSYLRKRTMGT